MFRIVKMHYYLLGFIKLLFKNITLRIREVRHGYSPETEALGYSLRPEAEPVAPGSTEEGVAGWLTATCVKFSSWGAGFTWQVISGVQVWVETSLKFHLSSLTRGFLCDQGKSAGDVYPQGICVRKSLFLLYFWSTVSLDREFKEWKQQAALPTTRPSHRETCTSLLGSLIHQRADSRSRKNYNPAACGTKTIFTER